jgi:hypothetical protein
MSVLMNRAEEVGFFRQKRAEESRHRGKSRLFQSSLLIGLK